MIIIVGLLAGVIAFDKLVGLGFNTLDYVFLGILFLSCLIGYFKGLILTIFSVVGYIAGAVLAKVFSPTVANILIEKTGIDKKVNDIVLNQFRSMNIPAFNVENAISSTDISGVDMSGMDMSGVDLSNFSDINSLTSQFPEAKQVFDANPMFGHMFEQYGGLMGGAKEQFTGATLSFIEASVYIIMLVLSAIAIFIFIKIVFALIGRIVSAVVKANSVLTSLNKWGGVTLGVFSGVLMLYVIINFIFPALSAFAASAPLLDEIKGSVICGLFMQNNGQ